MRRLTQGVLGALALVPALTLVLSSMAAAAAPTALAVALDATLDPTGRVIHGHARLQITNVSAAPLTEVQLWLYPNHLATRAAALTDVSFHWMYPALFSPAAMDLGAVHVDGATATAAIGDGAAGGRTLARIPLAAPLAPGARAIVDVDFATTIPQRFGGFGCVDGRCRLMGGFYPTPLHLGPDGWQAEAPPDRADVTVSLRAPAGFDVIVNGQPARGGPTPIVAAAADAPYATVICDRPLNVAATRAGGFAVRYLHHQRRPPADQGRFLRFFRQDVPALVLDTVGQALDFLQTQRPAAAADAPSPAPRPLLLIQAPLRHELVQVHGDVVLVSDRIFGIFPLERLRKYHRIELTRAVFKAALAADLGAVEPGADRDLAASVLAAALVDAFTLRTYHRVEFVRDLLRPVDFIPAVDQLMYAPVVASPATYFGDVDDGDRVRDDVRRFSHQVPDGRLIYNKLLDLLGPEGMTRLTARVLLDRQPLRAAAAQSFGADLTWFWRQWLGPRPRVNVRLLSVRAQQHGEGEQVVIDVARQLADRPVREPIEIEVRDRRGGARTLLWNDDQPQRRFQVDLPARLDSVEVDPRGRLIESALGDLNPSDDPRYDNRQPQRWRLIYSGFGGLLNVTQLSANFAAIFLLKPAHDLRHALVLQAFHSEAVQIGVGATGYRFFGRQATRNTLTSGLLAGLSAARLDPTFGLAAGDAPRPGWRLAARAGIEHDDRDFLFDPWHAVGFDAIVSTSLTVPDSGRTRAQATVAVDALRLFELLPGHVLALEAEAAATFGALDLRSQLLSAGGPTGLRGFFADELLARAQSTVRLQLRDDYLTDLDWNLLHLTSVRGLAGTLFADATAISACDGYGFSRGGLFADAGYSFRVLHEGFGVYQQLLSIDLAVPLNRPTHGRDCLGAAPDGVRPRFVVLVSFLPNF